MNTTTAETQLPARGLSAFLVLSKDIKLSHTVFALPFALLGMMLAAGYRQALPGLGEVALILVCMVTARTFAMCVNRWADRKIDAANPRTAGRALASGKVTSGFVMGTIVLTALLFVAAAGGFGLAYENWWPALLSPLVLLWLAGYSYAKRYTALCHVVLGIALAISPVAAAIAIDPEYVFTATPWLLAGVVACWVAGFDIIYALQDVAVDREAGLYSMPSRLGVEPALWISRLLHLLTIALLALMLGVSPQLDLYWALGIGIAGTLLVLEHALIIASPQRHLNMAFFTVNGILSVVLGTLGIIDVLLV